MRGDWFLFQAYRAVSWGVSRLPLRAVVWLGRGAGKLVWHVAGRYRRLVRNNLRIAFGAEMSEGEVDAVGREHFARLFGNLLAGAKLAQMDPKAVLERVEVEGLEHVRKVAAQGRGAVMILGHLGNWELLAQVTPGIFGCPCGSVYQSLSNAYVDASVRALRAKQGLALFARKEGFSQAMEMLRAPSAVGVLADQHAGDQGVWAPFFGRLASSSPLPATMALRTGAALVPAAMYTLPGARWRFVIEAPQEPVSRDVNAVTAQVNGLLERQIRVSPSDWLWAHNRWKTPKPKFLLSGAKRGIVQEGIRHRFRLVVRSPNWLGDAVMTLPAVRAMRGTRPDLEITVLTEAKLAEFWERMPEVDRVLQMPPGKSLWKTGSLLRGKGYDAIVLFPNSLRAGLEAWLSGIGRRVGYRGHHRGWCLNQVVETESGSVGRLGTEHHALRYLRLAEAMGAVRLAQEEWGKASPKGVQRLEREATLRLAVCPGAEYGPAKRWHAARFGAVMTEVSARYPCEWQMVGVAKDVPIGAEIEAAFRGEHLRNWMGRTSLGELMDLLAGCQVLLTNDTGTMHLAAALGVPVVAIFGSTEPLATGPIGEGHRVLQHRVPCGPCFQRACHLDFACMEKVKVEEVVEAVCQVVARVLA